MTSDDIRYCTVCGESYEKRELSTRGICRKCAKRQVLLARNQIVKKQGDIYQRYADNMAAGNARRKAGD